MPCRNYITILDRRVITITTSHFHVDNFHTLSHRYHIVANIFTTTGPDRPTQSHHHHTISRPKERDTTTTPTSTHPGTCSPLFLCQRQGGRSVSGGVARRLLAAEKAESRGRRRLLILVQPRVGHIEERVGAEGELGGADFAVAALSMTCREETRVSPQVALSLEKYFPGILGPKHNTSCLRLCTRIYGRAL